MRRIRWLGVILGSVTTALLAGVLLAFISAVVDPYFSAITGTSPVNGVTSVTTAQDRAHGLLTGGAVVSALIFAFLLGGLAAGRFAPSYAGLNGALPGAIILSVPLFWLAGNLVLVVLDSPQNLGESATRSESLSMLLAALLVFCVVSPVLVLSGFLGGRIGRR